MRGDADVLTAESGGNGNSDPYVGADPHAALIHHTLDRLVAEDVAGLDLLPKWPAAWWGLPVEVHDLPTRHGRISFAVRWHGERPALLWQLDAGERSEEIELTASGLDPAWRGSGQRGEALLAVVSNPSSGRAAVREGESFA
jgi:hypothetical protein